MWQSHNYFGPGASDYSTTPIESDDGIARQHNLLYESARSFDDIHEADAKAIKEFGEDAITNVNWHSALGATALGMKYTFVGMTNKLIYPRLQESFERTDDRVTKEIIDKHIGRRRRSHGGNHNLTGPRSQ
jgi:hypothetical protein